MTKPGQRGLEGKCLPGLDMTLNLLQKQSTGRYGALVRRDWRQPGGNQIGIDKVGLAKLTQGTSARRG